MTSTMSDGEYWSSPGLMVAVMRDKMGDDGPVDVEIVGHACVDG